MAKKEIRTKYIKSLVADKDKLAKVLEESTRESLSSLLDESVNRSIRQMIAESADSSYEEEEVDPNEPEFDTEEPNETDTETNDVENHDGVDNFDGEGDDTNIDGDENVNLESGDDAEGSDVWDEVEDCKDIDGEYDLREKNIDTVIELIKNMDKDSDGVRIIPNGDNTATVEADGGEVEFVIDINGDSNTEEPNEFKNGLDGEDEENGEEGTLDSEDGLDFNGEDDENEFNYEGHENDSEDNEEPEYELELNDNNEETEDNDMVNENNVNLGYTTNYQKKTAMTLPHDKGKGEGDSRFDDGAPTGDGRRWVGHKGANGGNPYSKKTKQPMTEEFEGNEEPIFEVEIDGDEMDVMEGASTITRNNAYTNSVGRNAVHSEEQDDKVRNSFRAGEQKRGTGYGRGTVSENRNMDKFQKQADAILAENKELRAIATQIKEKLNEAVVINSSLAKVIKLVTENSTTRDEKINILNRFNKVQSINESCALYNQITSELNNTAHRNNGNLLNNQISEARSRNNNMVVETNMLNTSSDLQQILSLQERLMNY